MVIRFSESRRWLLAAFALAGALSGVIAKVADESTVSELSDLGTSSTVWMLALSLIGASAPTPVSAAIRSTVFFVAMCAGYYGWSLLVLGFPGGGALLVAWLAVALTIVPLGAALIRWACGRSGFFAGAVIAAAGGVALSDPAVIQLWYAANGDLPPDFPLRPVQGMIGVATALIITLAVARHRATRGWAIALLLPMGFAAVMILDVLRGRLIPG